MVFQLMLEALKRKWKIGHLQKKMNRLSRNIADELRNSEDYESLEYGNLRKGPEWGVVESNTVSWTYLIDLIIGKPILYIINYDLIENKFICYAKTPKTNFSSVFQFKTTDFKELDFRLLELARHIPSLRERMLREYIYSEFKKGPRKKWYKPFVSDQKLHSYLESAISEIAGTNKITHNEATRLRAYARNLV